jgi:hypothetical protein
MGMKLRAPTRVPVALRRPSPRSPIWSFSTSTCPIWTGTKSLVWIQTLSLSPKPFLVAVADSAKDADVGRCARAGFDLCIPEPISPTVFEALADLVLVSKGLVARSRDIANRNRTVLTSSMLRHIEIAQTLLDSAEVSLIHALTERCIARATAVHDRVSTWLDTGACDDRRPKVGQALRELRARLFRDDAAAGTGGISG